MSKRFKQKWGVHTETHSMGEIRDLYKETLLDGNFQRYGGYRKGSGWTKKQGKEYIQHFVRGETFNFVIVVDVEQALWHARKAKDQESIDYFENVLEDGYKYVSIDGNNTSSFISAFMNNEEEFAVKLFESPIAKTFKGYTKKEQNKMEHEDKIDVKFITKISIREMCELFRNLNTSTSLNEQEYRQARWSKLSKFIRDASNGPNVILFTNLILTKDSDIDKRVHESLVAQLASKLNGKYAGRDVKKTGLDLFYKETTHLESALEKRIMSILAETLKIAKAKGSQKQKLSKGKIHTLWDVIQMVTQEYDCEIKDYERFYEWFLRNDTRWDATSLEITAADEEEKSYSHWVKFYAARKNWQKIRLVWESLIHEDMGYNINSGILARKRNSSQNFNFKQKLELLRLQRNTTRSEEKVSYIDLYIDPSKWEADHMVSVKDGGKTTIENGELMSRFDNRSKGSKSNEPYFPHQKQKVSNEQPSI